MKRAAAAALALLALAECRAGAPVEAKDAPEINVLTSLPLLFDDGFALGPAKGEAATFLREHYRLRPIDLPSQLPEGAVLLAAQPRALPAEELVALDAWVRRGGKLLLLADPMLEWPSKRPLGDRLRPPVQYADTGLLLHWGLRLDAPDKRGIVHERRGGEVAFVSPGTFVRIGGDCDVEKNGSLAYCRLGKGSALVIADADFLNVEVIRKSGGSPTDNLAIIEKILSQPPNVTKPE